MSLIVKALAHNERIITVIGHYEPPKPHYDSLNFH